MSRNKEFTLVNITDALYEAEFAAAHWERLGLQLKRPPAQLTNIEADRTDVNGKLTSMVGQWMRSDLSASWESVAAALNKTPGYGPATASRFRRAYELSDDDSRQSDQTIKDRGLRRRDVAGTDQGETNVAETHRPSLASQSSVESTVPSSGPSLLGIFCFVILLLISTLLIVAVFIRVVESYM